MKNDSNRRDSSQVLEHQELQNLTRIASSLHEQHPLGGSLRLSGNDEDHVTDPSLDPGNDKFDHYKWAQRALSSLGRSGIKLQGQGIVFSNLSVSGTGSSLQFQETVASSFTVPFRKILQAVSGHRKNTRRQILKSFDGLLNDGELLLVLGRPGSGCSTFLKTICGQTEGLKIEPESNIQYRGVGYSEMAQRYRGEVAYNQEVDEHFPHLTVGETLSFAAAARAPRQRPQGLTRTAYVETVVKVVMGVFGLSHTHNTKVGDNFVRGVSGGERKRVSIAEMFLSRARIGAWDNSTRGLDSATALQFIKSLRLSADLGRSCHAVAAYQPSQSMFELFDKVILLYEGQEIFFGPRSQAVRYFQSMGWHRDPQQVVPDFLTAITNPGERRPRPGMESQVPRTASEFANYWQKSEEHRQLQAQIGRFREQNPISAKAAEEFADDHERQQARHTRGRSPFLLSAPMQIRLCLKRAFQRMRNDIPSTAATVVVQVVLAFIIGSIFYNSPNNSQAFFQKGAVIFFAILMSAMITITEIMFLYGQRPIVEKQARYAFVHPVAEALASSIADLPVKVLRCSIFSIVLYFLVNLRREPAQFFTFYLFVSITILTMSGMFRTVAMATKTISQAMVVAGILIICFVVYSGFMVPQTYMHPWFSWIRWLNPIFYSFESLLSNEFHGRNFPCAMLVPPYGTGQSVICAAVGAVPGQTFIQGDAFLLANYKYEYAHIWRNLGILIAFMLFFHFTYFAAAEFNKSHRSKAEALVFRPGHAPKYLRDTDVESSESGVGAPSSTEPGTAQKMTNLPPHEDVLTWKNLNYDIPVKDGTRRLLDDVNGWVKPGTLTALMGVSGAGKTTLLDVLAQRAPIGVVSGDILVNGQGLNLGFTRRTGYVQQQDMHLETTTVREALRFSAVLRQPGGVSKTDKYAYVEEVIQMLGMEDFSEAVVGVQGEGLNVEQRKLLSIGVELVAKPSLLIFLDEPTSGLDSQSSWAICSFLRKLADHGQAVLATIHQPSALLFQTFDRLLFLAQGGKTVYFGDIGGQSRTLLEYFTRNGARECGEAENPAEYMLQIVSGNETPHTDWAQTWKSSAEYKEVNDELDQLNAAPQQRLESGSNAMSKDFSKEFALPLHLQFRHVAGRAFSQYFRQPEYIFTKFLLAIVSGLFIGFSFWKADQTQQGFQNALFSIFLLTTIFPPLVNQVIPKFIMQRSLYEVRERPSRVYSWKVFILSQMLVEVPWQILLGICSFACFFFPVFGTSATSESMGLILLFVVQFYVYAATIGQMVVAAIPDPALGTLLAVMMFGLSFIFNGVMQPPDALPGFWKFMWRVSPFTYYISGMSSTALHGRQVVCSEREMSILDPPSGQSCGQYLQRFLLQAPGRLDNPDATSQCRYCGLSSADQYLAARRIDWDDRWRNYGIFICYMAFNVFGTVTLYYVFRVRSFKSRKVAAKK